MTGNRYEHLKRAKDLLTTGEPANVRYAALELRLCLEAMTYQKLNSFQKQLPPSFLKQTWQPPKLLKAMVQLDPGADKSFQLFVGLESEYGVPPPPERMQFVGEHKAFGLTWLTKNYNKLGSFLHLPMKSTPHDVQKRHADLTAIAAEIEEAQKGSILGSWFGELVHFECQVCHETSAANRHFIEMEHRATCSNQTCEAEYIVEAKGDGKFAFLLRANDFPCLGCGQSVVVEMRHMAAGYIAACPSCKKEHVIQCQWGYAEHPLPTPKPSSAS